MTNAFEIRRARPAHPPKSGCGVPPQAVREASRLPSSAPKLTIFRLNRIQGVWASFCWRCTAQPPRPHSFFSILVLFNLHL
jgi:hypothetical protein